MFRYKRSSKVFYIKRYEDTHNTNKKIEETQVYFSSEGLKLVKKILSGYKLRPRMIMISDKAVYDMSGKPNNPKIEKRTEISNVQSVVLRYVF